MQKHKVKVNKAVCIGCTAGVLAASASILCGAAASAKAYVRLDKSDFLKTGGRLIKNARGETVVLRGVDIGGWLIQESPEDLNNGEESERGCIDTLALLVERFGDEKANQLLNIYLDNWITAHDLDRLKKFGVNCVRIPFTYRNFQRDDNGTWIRNKDGGIDFSKLDWMVTQCGKRGIYVLIAMHGAPGFQRSGCSRGKADTCELFDCSLAGLKYRQRTAELWQVLARHFKGNPAVAAFELLDEPMNRYPGKENNDKPLWQLYNKLYKAVRAEDPNRMLMVDGFEDMKNLPDPKDFCRQNIVYHLRVCNSSASEIDQMIAEINARAEWNVPVLIRDVRADAIGDYTLSALNENALNWCICTYKGIKTPERTPFLYKAGIETANLQEDSFEQIKAKWGNPCRTTESFSENTELAAVLKKYLTGAVRTIEDLPNSADPALLAEVYDMTEGIPNKGDKKSADPVKFVYGTNTLVGMGTLAELTNTKHS